METLSYGSLLGARGAPIHLDLSMLPGIDTQESVCLPLKTRILLAHALVERIANQRGIPILHIKGYAVDVGLYAPGRTSSDVDVLVRPEAVDEFIAALHARGWKTVTEFETGSLFRHASTLWHDSWGHLDVHRSFPGIQLSPEVFFSDLWECRGIRLIADTPCTIPSRGHQALVIALHAGRDQFRGKTDMQHIRSVLDEEQWEDLRGEAERVGALLAFAAATGTLAKFEGHPQHDIWAILSSGGSRTELLLARFRAASSCRSGIGVLFSALSANGDHLRMRLQREPTAADFSKEVFDRARELLSALCRRSS